MRGRGRVAVGEGHQHLHRAQRAGTERLGCRRHPGADLMRRVELAQQAVAQHHRQRRHRHRDQDRRCRHRRRPRPAHHPADPVTPEPRLGGFGTPRPVQRRRPLGGRPAEGCQHRRRHGRRRQHRHRDRENRAGGHRRQRRGVDQVDPGQRRDDGHPGQHHREARRRHRRVDRLLGLASGTQFLAEAHQDEQRIVDRQRDAEHRHRRGDEDRHRGVGRQQIDQPHRDRDGADAQRQRDRGGGKRAEHRQQHDQDDRKVPPLGVGDVVFGVGRRGRAERALADDVQPDPAVLHLARPVALDADFGTQLLGGVAGAGVVGGVQSQRHHIRPVGLRRRLGRIGHHRHVGDLPGDLLQKSGRGVHVFVAGIRARRRHQRQRRRALVGVMRLQLVVDAQRLGSRHLEAAAGEVTRLGHRQVDRGYQREQPTCEDQPAESAQVAA